MIDLSFLTEAEQESILKVLQRDADLKKVEEQRIRHLQDVVDDSELKYKSGQWFYEAKSKRHRDKIHGADLVRASIRKRKKPATIAELGKSNKDKAKKSWVNSVNKDIFIPPELAGVMEEPEDLFDDIKPAKVEKNQSARKVSFLAPDKEKSTLMNGAASPLKQRKNPFNSKNAGLDVTDIAGDGLIPTLVNGVAPIEELPKPEKLSSKVKFGVKLPYPDLNGGSPIPLRTDASSKTVGEFPVPKPRKLINDQVLDRSSSQVTREDSVNGTGRPRGILKRCSSSSSTDSENIRLAHTMESNRIALPGSPILEVQQESAVADTNGSTDSVDRLKHVRFSSKVLQKTPPQSPEPYSGKEINEFRILDQGLSNAKLDTSVTEKPSEYTTTDVLDFSQVNVSPRKNDPDTPNLSVTTSTLSSTSLVSDVDDVLDSTLSEKPNLDKNLTLQTNISTDPLHIYAVINKVPEIPSVEMPEFVMGPSPREPRVIGKEGTPLEFGKSYGGGGKTSYDPRFPVSSPEHLDLLSKEQPKYNSPEKPAFYGFGDRPSPKEEKPALLPYAQKPDGPENNRGKFNVGYLRDDKELLKPKQANFNVMSLKDRIDDTSEEVRSNPLQFQNLKSFWNFDGKSPSNQETKASPGKLQDSPLYKGWQRKDLDHGDDKGPGENVLLPNTFDLSEEEQSSHKVATWLAQTSNLYEAEPVYSEDQGDAGEGPKEEPKNPDFDVYKVETLSPVQSKMIIYEQNPPKKGQGGLIGFEKMTENSGNLHEPKEVIKKTMVTKNDNKEFISALEKLEIEASQTDEAHVPNARDAPAVPPEETKPTALETRPIVEEEIVKDAVETEKSSADFYNRLLELEAEHKQDPNSEEPEDFATNEIKVSQFPNKEVSISKKVYSRSDFMPSEGTPSVEYNGSGPTDTVMEGGSLLDNYLNTAAKNQPESTGLYEKNMGNDLNKKPEIDSPDVSKLKAVSAKKGKPAQVAVPHETDSFKPDKYTIEVMKAKDESITKVLDWFSRSSDSNDETPPINALERKSEKNGLPSNPRGSLTKTGKNIENSDPVDVTPEKIQSDLETPMAAEQPKAMDHLTSDVRGHSRDLHDDSNIQVSLDALNPRDSNVDTGEPLVYGKSGGDRIIHKADKTEAGPFQDSESCGMSTEDFENADEPACLYREKGSIVVKSAATVNEEAPESLGQETAVSIAWRKPGILQKTESERNHKASSPIGDRISVQELGSRSSSLIITVQKNDGKDGSKESRLTGDYRETSGEGSLVGSDGESPVGTLTVCATESRGEAPESANEEVSIAWRKPGILENPEYVDQSPVHEHAVPGTVHDLDLESGKSPQYECTNPALKKDTQVVCPKEILLTMGSKGTALSDNLVDNEDHGSLVTFTKVIVEDEGQSPSISRLRSFWENGKVESEKNNRKVNLQVKPDQFRIKQASGTDSLKSEDPEDKLSSTNDPSKVRKRHTFHHLLEKDSDTATKPCVRSISVGEEPSRAPALPKSAFQNVRNFWNVEKPSKVGNVEKIARPSVIHPINTSALKNKKPTLIIDDGRDKLHSIEYNNSGMTPASSKTYPESDATSQSQPESFEKELTENSCAKNVSETTYRTVAPRKDVDLHGMLQKLKNEVSEEHPTSVEHKMEPISQTVPLEEFAQVQNMDQPGEKDGEHDKKAQSSATGTKAEVQEVIEDPIILKAQSSSFSLRLQSLYNEYSKFRTRSGELAGADDIPPSDDLSFGRLSTKVSVGSLNRSDITDQNSSGFLDCKTDAFVSSNQPAAQEVVSNMKSSETDQPEVCQNQEMALAKPAEPSPPVRKVVSEIIIKSQIPKKVQSSEFNIKLMKLRSELSEEDTDASGDLPIRSKRSVDDKVHLSSQKVHESVHGYEVNDTTPIKISGDLHPRAFESTGSESFSQENTTSPEDVFEESHNEEKPHPLEIEERVEKSHNLKNIEAFNDGLNKLVNECREMEYDNSNCDVRKIVPSAENGSWTDKVAVDEKIGKTVLSRTCFSNFDAGLEKLYKESMDEVSAAGEKPLDLDLFEKPKWDEQPVDISKQMSSSNVTNFSPAAQDFSTKGIEGDTLSPEPEPLKPSAVRSCIEISKAYVPQKVKLIEIKPGQNETDFDTSPAPLNLKISYTGSILEPVIKSVESLESQNTTDLNPTLEQEVSPSVPVVVSHRLTVQGRAAMPQRQNKKEILEKVEKPVVLPRTRFNYFESGLLKLYKESMGPTTHLETSDAITSATQASTQQDAEKLKEGVSFPADLRPEEDVESNLGSCHTMQPSEEQRSDSFTAGVNKEDVAERVDKTTATTRQAFAESLERLQKVSMTEESSCIGNTFASEPTRSPQMSRPSVSLELTDSDAQTADTTLEVGSLERRTWRGRSQDREKPSSYEDHLDSTLVMPSSSTPINQSIGSLRKSTLELYLETPYRREMSKSVDFVLKGYVSSEGGKQCSINPILSALKRSEAKSIPRSVLDVTPTIPNEDEADELKDELKFEIPIDTDIPESQFSNPDKLKQLSKSVPALLHDETDGRDTDSASESSFQIGNHKKTPSSLTNLSGSSGMASMSSVSGSVMSVYSGDFGNVDVKGKIQFAVDYVDQLKEFHVFVSQCKDLAVGDVKKQRSDPYVKSYLLPEKAKMGKRKTAVKKKTLNPAYNEILRYKIDKDTLLAQKLNVSVWHNDALGRNSFLGEVELQLDEWDWNNKQMNWYSLQPRTPAAGIGLENRGEIKLALKYVPALSSGSKSSQTGEVHIWIKDCVQLPQLRGNKINSFVKCTILPDTSRKSRQRTRTVDKTPNPSFNHTMVYDGFKEEDLKEACVELTVWDHNKLSNHFLGGLRIGLGTGKSYGTAVDWMDSSPEESTMWEKMIKSTDTWIEEMLPLRMLKIAKITK